MFWIWDHSCNGHHIIWSKSLDMLLGGNSYHLIYMVKTYIKDYRYYLKIGMQLIQVIFSNRYFFLRKQNHSIHQSESKVAVQKILNALAILDTFVRLWATIKSTQFNNKQGK